MYILLAITSPTTLDPSNHMGSASTIPPLTREADLRFVLPMLFSLWNSTLLWIISSRKWVEKVAGVARHNDHQKVLIE